MQKSVNNVVSNLLEVNDAQIVIVTYSNNSAAEGNKIWILALKAYFTSTANITNGSIKYIISIRVVFILMSLFFFKLPFRCSKFYPITNKRISYLELY